MIGQRVAILGGFENGIVGTVNAVRESNGRTVHDVITDDGTQLAGFNVARLDPIAPPPPHHHHNGMTYRTRTRIGCTVEGRPVYTVETMPTDPEHWAYGVWDPVASVSAHDLDAWPDTPYCNGQRAALTSHPRTHPERYTAGACAAVAGEWYAGFDDATIGKFYGRQP